VEDFDPFRLITKGRAARHLIFKHAIPTIETR